MDDEQTSSAENATTKISHKPHITWSDSQTKTGLAIESLTTILPSIPSTLATSDSPALSLLHDSNISSNVSRLLRQPDSGAVDDNLCGWLYDTFHSSILDLQLVVLRFLPVVAGTYLSRATLNKPLAGFESVLLAIYAHETAARNGQAVSVSIPDLSHPSLYHEMKQVTKNSSTELHLAVISPSLEPHGTVRSTRRARIVGVALELYYSKISQIPMGSKIEFCEFCRIWSGQSDPSSEISNDSNEEIRSKKGEGRKGRIDLPWELLQPILRILGHCLMWREKNYELFDAAYVACRCLHARSLHDINPKAILATGSLLNLAKAADESDDDPDYTEIEITNHIKV